MATLAVNPVGPVALGVLNALRPVQALAVTPAQNDQSAGSSTLSIQALTQTLFQRTLQAATLFPLTEPASGSASLAQDAAASLLAALNAPQAAADTTPAATTSATVPAPVQVADTTTSTAPPSAPPPAVIGDLSAAQDAFALSSSPDFAMQTALRFGAGVASQAAPALPSTDLGAGLVRDAASVQRLANLQSQAGSPGPEAFATPQAAIQRVLRSYETTTAASAIPGVSNLDFFA